MSRKSDQETQHILDNSRDDIGGVKSPEPAFQRYRKRFIQELDYEKLKKLDPRQVISSARTYEEIIALGEYLHSEYGNNHPWWDSYHRRRALLASRPSLYGIDPTTGKGLWGAPVAPVRYVKDYGNPTSLQDIRVQRNLYHQALTWEQITGQQSAFNLTGGKFANWNPLAGPSLPSNTPKNPLFFDLETTGLLKKNSNIVSLGLSSIKGNEALYAKFPEGRKFEKFIEGVIRPNWEKAVSAGATPVSEKDLIQSMISRIGSHDALMGFNINKFDIPMLREAASKYGLVGQLEDSLSRANIIDVADYVKPFLSKKLGAEYLSWASSEFGDSAFGWKLEAIAAGLKIDTAAIGLAHDARADAVLTASIWDVLKDSQKSKEALDSFDVEAYISTMKRITGRAPTKLKEGMNALNYSVEMGPREEDFLKPFNEYISERYPKRLGVSTAKTVVSNVSTATAEASNAIPKTSFGKTAKNTFAKLQKMGAGRVLSTAAVFTGTNMLLPGGFWENAINTTAFEGARIAAKSKGITGWKGLAIGAGASVTSSLLVNALKPESSISDEQMITQMGGYQFSSHNSNYNTIEGLRDEGLRQSVRKELTEFGSGWQGSRDLPSVLMGVPIDPEVLKFRQEVIDDPSAIAEIEADIKAKQASAMENVGDFRPEDIGPEAQLTSGVSSDNPNLRKVNLSDYKITVEDADTIILSRKGLASLISKDIQIRLSGLDAPETAGHKNDPMADVRIWQDQPGGKESASAFQQLVEQQKNIQLIIDPTNKTYGRYLGALIGDDDVNINVEAVRRGLATALPFGEESGDVVSRRSMAQAEAAAKAEQAGIWQYARYQAIAEANKQIGGPITYNTLTELTRLGKNLNLGAYGSFLETLGDRTTPLTQRELYTAQTLGRSLKKTHDPNKFKSSSPKPIVLFNGDPNRLIEDSRISGKDDDYNTIEGLRHDGIAQDTRHALTDFGSGWDPLRKIASQIYKGVDEDAFKLLRESDEFKLALQSGKEIKELGFGAFGTTYLMESKIGDETFQYVKKIPKTILPDTPSAIKTGERTGVKINDEVRQRVIEREGSALSKVEDRISPSLYHFDKESSSLYMEAMPGDTLYNIMKRGEQKLPANLTTRINKEAIAAAKLGVVNTDLHLNNFMYDFKTDKLSWIDFGLARTESNPSKEWIKQSSNEMLYAVENNAGIGLKKELAARTVPPEGIRTIVPGGFDAEEDWGNVISNNIPMPKTVPNKAFGIVIPEPQIPVNSLKQEQVMPVQALKRHIRSTGEIPSQRNNVEIDIQDTRRTKRINNFRKVSTASVGAGLKSTHNAGRRHSTSATNRSS